MGFEVDVVDIRGPVHLLSTNEVALVNSVIEGALPSLQSTVVPIGMCIVVLRAPEADFRPEESQYMRHLEKARRTRVPGRFAGQIACFATGASGSG